MRAFLQKLNHHRDQKDISEVLEKLPSSKQLSKAHRVFQQIMICVWISQTSVFSKDDCDQLKAKKAKTHIIQEAPRQTNNM